ncbi:MAG TPA: hypothetical protein VGE45_11775 [Chloroflexia bacterium]|jgi:hypothetical protein
METFNLQVSQAVTARLEFLAETVVERQYRLQPDLMLRYGEVGREKCLQDTKHHLSSILSAIALSTPGVFVEYVIWVRGLLEAHNVPSEDLARNLTCIRDVLRDELPEEISEVAVAYVEAGLKQLANI